MLENRRPEALSVIGLAGIVLLIIIEYRHTNLLSSIILFIPPAFALMFLLAKKYRLVLAFSTIQVLLGILLLILSKFEGLLGLAYFIFSLMVLAAGIGGYKRRMLKTKKEKNPASKRTTLIVDLFHFLFSIGIAGLGYLSISFFSMFFEGSAVPPEFSYYLVAYYLILSFYVISNLIILAVHLARPIKLEASKGDRRESKDRLSSVVSELANARMVMFASIMLLSGLILLLFSLHYQSGTYLQTHFCINIGCFQLSELSQFAQGISISSYVTIFIGITLLIFKAEKMKFRYIISLPLMALVIFTFFYTNNFLLGTGILWGAAIVCVFAFIGLVVGLVFSKNLSVPVALVVIFGYVTLINHPYSNFTGITSTLFLFGLLLLLYALVEFIGKIDSAISQLSLIYFSFFIGIVVLSYPSGIFYQGELLGGLSALLFILIMLKNAGSGAKLGATAGRSVFYIAPALLSGLVIREGVNAATLNLIGLVLSLFLILLGKEDRREMFNSGRAWFAIGVIVATFVLFNTYQGYIIPHPVLTCNTTAGHVYSVLAGPENLYSCQNPELNTTYIGNNLVTELSFTFEQNISQSMYNVGFSCSTSQTYPGQPDAYFRWIPAIGELITTPYQRAVIFNIPLNADVGGQLPAPPYKADVTTRCYNGENNTFFLENSSLENIPPPLYIFIQYSTDPNSTYNWSPQQIAVVNTT